MSASATASQTVGPFFRIGLEPLYLADLAPTAAAKKKINFHGRVLDGDAQPVSDAILEIWQANADGRYLHPDDLRESPRDGFTGFGRVPTDAQGRFQFSTVKPGRVAGPNGKAQAPHLVVAIFMRGLLIHLLTRVYFPGDPANADDPILQLVPAARRATLIANAADGGLEWNVILQGEHETVFFDY
ncbi:MAG TPA: protocatechuate 3,4-dioxygenase subunit alpha [Burkholderiales bacterium]|nr:protocatechuate 3,4-dioxygenase subunit alpha [Burkholderiales bacterium]